MKFQAILARTTTDHTKSKILSPELCEVVLDAYMTPAQFAELIEHFSQMDFEVEVRG